MTVRPNSLEARDVAHVLHPYTNAVVHEQDGPMVLSHGDGIHVVDTEGNRYIEALSGSSALRWAFPSRDWRMRPMRR